MQEGEKRQVDGWPGVQKVVQKGEIEVRDVNRGVRGSQVECKVVKGRMKFEWAESKAVLVPLASPFPFDKRRPTKRGPAACLVNPLHPTLCYTMDVNTPIVIGIAGGTWLALEAHKQAGSRGLFG